MNTYITLSAAKIRKDVEPNGVAIDVEGMNPESVYDLYIECKSAVASDATCLVASDEAHADMLREEMRQAGATPGESCPVYWVKGPSGDVVHAIYSD